MRRDPAVVALAPWVRRAYTGLFNFDAPEEERPPAEPWFPEFPAGYEPSAWYRENAVASAAWRSVPDGDDASGRGATPELPF